MSRFKIWSRLLLHPVQHLIRHPPRHPSPLFLSAHFISKRTRNFSTDLWDLPPKARWAAEDRALQELTYEEERERQREREERIKAGLPTADLDAEDEEDYMGVDPLIEKLMKEEAKGDNNKLMQYEEATDSESEDEQSAAEASEEKVKIFDKKFEKYEELLDKFNKAGTPGDKYNWMKKINNFEEKHFKLRLEYRVIGDLMNRMKVAEGKEKFLLQVKLNRALRMVEYKEAFDPNDPANYGIIQQEELGFADFDETEKEPKTTKSRGDEDDVEVDEKKDDSDMEFDDLKEKDTILLKKLNELDKKLEKKLADLEYTFGKKGKLLEEEIRNLAEERNSLTEEKRKPLYRKGFDVKLIDVNRTCKVTKGGQVIKYTAMIACGNYNGVVGFAKAKGPGIPVALQKAYEKCFQNLHYIERHEEHTIAHSIQTSYKKTKVYLWPAATTTGMKAGRTVQTILNLAGFKNVKSKVVGSRNPHNTVKAVFKALNAIETPKDVQEKFGRTVVESYLL
ncbi:hypothetical protein ACJIZ3_008671 [Penstemon smallii]|uniref:S5 DRBM domain-containing protein n=1 Tax=Penstemon smallii TaxID=265156 RepID=A0ABD3TBN8_9LAMI